MTKAMERLEKLSTFVNRNKDLTTKFEDLKKEINDNDKTFADWLQKELNIQDTSKTYHISEMMKIMLETSIDVAKSN